MAGQTLDLEEYLSIDQIGMQISDQFITWDNLRAKRKTDWLEVQQYIFQTDTTQTSNSTLPWRNTTTVPKLCQIRDNLYSNYIATMFPKRKWLIWQAENRDDALKPKKDAITNYMSWAVDRPEFKTILKKLVLDYLDYGNTFVSPDWTDQRIELPDKTQVGYVGPIPVRYSPNDVVVNPTAPTMADSPKIIRSLVTLGELKKYLMTLSTPDDYKEIEELFNYLREIRHFASTYDGALVTTNDSFSIAGFGNFKDYLLSEYVEVLTFYGDLFVAEENKLYENHKIMIVDRHKTVYKKPNPSFFGKPPIYHSGWRVRQDNLWAMGPLDNLIGMQYRIDHLENMKADIMDLTTFPVQKIKGFVEDYEWGPMAKIFTGDDGDVTLLTPPVQALQVNLEITELSNRMEEMAGSPKEAMGIRSPGEKTAYEVQRLENAASRIFQNKIAQFEEEVLEPLLNGMLELARRKMSTTTINFFDDETQASVFMDLTPEDITGAGRIRPIAARHFAEQAQLLQNLNNLGQSQLYQDPQVKAHFSGIGIAKMLEELLEFEDYRIVQENIRISETADTQQLANVHDENTAMQSQTPAGIAADDVG